MSGVAATNRTRRLRVAIRAPDAERRRALRELVEMAGHTVAEAEEPADAVLCDASLIDRPRLMGPSGFHSAPDDGVRPILTPRETQVLDALADGLTNKSIARRLGISLHTVKFHLESVYRKLEARTRTEAVARALEWRRDETLDL